MKKKKKTTQEKKKKNKEIYLYICTNRSLHSINEKCYRSKK